MNCSISKTKCVFNFIFVLILLLSLAFSVSANNNDSILSYIWYDDFEDGNLSDYIISGTWVIENGYLKSVSGGDIRLNEVFNLTTNISIAYDFRQNIEGSYLEFFRSSDGFWEDRYNSIWTSLRSYQDRHWFMTDETDSGRTLLGCGSVLPHAQWVYQYCEYNGQGSTIHPHINGTPCSSPRAVGQSSYAGRTTWGFGNFITPNVRVDNLRIWEGTCDNPPEIITEIEEEEPSIPTGWVAQYSESNITDAGVDTLVKFILSFGTLMAVLIFTGIGSWAYGKVKK